MKDRNTIIFYYTVGIIIILIAFTAPFTGNVFEKLFALLGLGFVLLAIYCQVIARSKNKTAFTISRMPSEKTAPEVLSQVPLKNISLEAQLKRP